MYAKLMLILTALLLGSLRIAGVTNEPFQALAHCFVGSVIGAGAVASGRQRWFYFGLAIALTVLEVLCFLYFKFLS